MTSPLFAKLAADIHTNPKIRRAGRNAREIYIFALCRNVFRGHDGILPGDDLEPDYLADQLLMTPAEAAEGLERAIACRLLGRDGHAITITGWEEFWGKMPKTEAERKSVQREKERAKLRKVTRASGQVTMWSGQDRDMSGPIVTCPDSHVGDQRRGDQRRGEEIREDPPQPATPVGDAPHTATIDPTSVDKPVISVDGDLAAQEHAVTPTGQPPVKTENDAPARNGAVSEAKREPADQAITLAELLLDLIQVNNPNHRSAKFPPAKRHEHITRWALEIEKLHRIDKVEWGTIHGMIEWCQCEPFWRGVILGGANLRDKWDTMMAQKTRKSPKKPEERNVFSEVDQAVEKLKAGRA